MTVSILGTAYTVKNKTAAQDVTLENCGGNVDFSTKIICIRDFTDGESRSNDEEDQSVCRNFVMRHECIHAFLYESGLHELARDETVVDWIALQFPKMLKAFNEMGCL